MRVTTKGQVTIPKDIRDRLGLMPETEVEFELDGKTARVVKVAPKKARTRGSQVVERLRGRATVRMSTDQILALTRRSK